MAERDAEYAAFFGRLKSSREVSPIVPGSLQFALSCNGYVADTLGRVEFDPDAIQFLIDDFNGQEIAFFGPNAVTNYFKPRRDVGFDKVRDVLGQESVVQVIHKYRAIDENQAARIAFILGGLARHLIDRIRKDVVCDYADFVAKMTKLGDSRSEDAVASAMAMYAISSRSTEIDSEFQDHVYRMANVVNGDSMDVLETRDLGISQLRRLRSFWGENTPDVSDLFGSFGGFPTVGAEFHFPMDTARADNRFWQRLALLNMSQYQPGSYIQFCRNDKGVIEVRMNPSIYPVAIALWNKMRLFLPELNRAFFHVTVNREGSDFTWENDGVFLNKLRKVGFLTYAAQFEDVPGTAETADINFGDVYLGQTVRLYRGRYQSPGSWLGGKGQSGQLSVYTGFGNNYPDLSYYLSMVVADPKVLDCQTFEELYGRDTLDDVMRVGSDVRRKIFRQIRLNIGLDPSLRAADTAGKAILQRLSS